jgi:hypothetical protein
VVSLVSALVIAIGKIAISLLSRLCHRLLPLPASHVLLLGSSSR